MSDRTETAIMDTVTAEGLLVRQESELKHNGRAPGNTWRDTLDAAMWTYHDQYGHKPAFADCIECTHVIVYLQRNRNALANL